MDWSLGEWSKVNVNWAMVYDWAHQLANLPFREVLPPPVEVDDVDQGLGERLQQLLASFQDHDHQPEPCQPLPLQCMDSLKRVNQYIDT